MLAGCGDDESQVSTPGSSASQPDELPVDSPGEDATLVGEVSEQLGCTITDEMDAFNAPLRTGTASVGVICELDEGGRLHLFERAVGPDGPVEQQLMSFGVYPEDEGLALDHACSDWLLVSERMVIAAADERAAHEVQAELPDVQFELVQPTSTPASYGLPSGCGGLPSVGMDED